MNTLETTDTPGAVRTTSSAGRMVCAVVVTQPETMPSASPACTIIVPKYDGSTTRSKATSAVMPLCARSAAYDAAKLLAPRARRRVDDGGGVDVDARAAPRGNGSRPRRRAG